MVDARDSVKEVKSAGKGSTCNDELIVVASASANEENAIESGGLMVEEEQVGEKG